MKLSIRGVSVAAGLLWGIALLFTGVLYVITGNYGEAFLNICGSVYPGFKVQPSMASILIGTGYALVDGAICGALFAWIYNLVVSGD